MDCPTCGLINPPEATKCDCGHNFETATPLESPGWPIDLAWGQKLAAYWSISWPAMVVAWTLAFMVTIVCTAGFVRKYVFWFSLGSSLLLYAAQSVFVHRLVRKNYRRFRVAVIRADAPPDRRFTTHEAMAVWLWIVAPQLILLLAVSTIAWLCSVRTESVAARDLSSWARLLQFLVVGPFATGLALRAHYNGFRLQAYGYRSV